MQTKSSLTVVISILCFAACGATSPRGRTATSEGRNDLTYLPSDVDFVISADIAAMRTSVYYQHVAPALFAVLEWPHATLIARCGFDPIERVNRVTFGSRQRDGEPERTMVVHGIAEADFVRCFKSEIDQGTLKKIGPRWIYASAENPTITWTAIDTLVADWGTRKATADSPAIVANTPELMAKWNKVAPGTIQFLGNATSEMFDEARQHQITELSGSATVTAHLSLTLDLVADAPNAAKEIVDDIKSAIGAHRVLFTRLEVTANASHVTGVAELTIAQTDAVVKMLFGGGLGFIL
jgi:hypothetical protein